MLRMCIFDPYYISYMVLSEITAYLESLAPLSLQEDYDNCGLLYGDPGWEITSMLLTLDLTSEVMDEALGKQCNLIISHHPFIFKGLKKLTAGNPETEIITKAARNNVAIYAMHTNLDNYRFGLNAILLRKLGITDFRILKPQKGTLRKLITFCPADHSSRVREALFSAHAGRIGNYDQCSFNVEGEGSFRALENSNPFVGTLNQLHVEKETRIEVIYHDYDESNVISNLLKSHPYEEIAYDIVPLENDDPESGAGLIGTLAEPLAADNFLARVKETLNIPFIRHTRNPDSRIRKVALCTGSGSFLIPDAMLQGADAFLTADIKYHDFFIASGKLLLADIGHYESEQMVKEWFHDVLIEKFPNFASLISEVNTNPVHYY